MHYKIGDIVMLSSPSHKHYYRIADIDSFQRHVSVSVASICLDDDRVARYVRVEPDRSYWSCMTYEPVDLDYYARVLELPGDQLLDLIELGKIAGLGQEQLT